MKSVKVKARKSRSWLCFRNHYYLSSYKWARLSKSCRSASWGVAEFWARSWSLSHFTSKDLKV